MTLARRTIMTTILAGGLLSRLARPALATVPANVSADTLPLHAVGDPGAKLVVQEWFSLTCTHCAHFSQVVFPEIKQKLIDTGRIRYVFHDFPLDQVALTAAMVADALPEERYLPFIEALFASQDRWAFNRDNDPVAELRKSALLAGLSPDAFEEAVNNDALRRAIVAAQDRAQKQYGIDGTPTFVFGRTVQPIVADYATFAGYVAAAGG